MLLAAVSEVHAKKSALATWLELDLGAAAAAERLEPAFGVQETLRRVAEVIAAGRNPVLVGEPGVGKTAVVHELVRQLHAGERPPLFKGRAVLQFSLGYGLSMVGSPSKLPASLQRLVQELCAQDECAVFVRDLHLAFGLGVASQFEVLSLRKPGLLLAEAESSAWASALEDYPGIEQHFVAVPVREPGLDPMLAILEAWRTQGDQRAARFQPEGVQQALQLTHRFLSRARDPRKTLEFLKQVSAVTAPEQQVARREVIDAFYQAYQVPRFLIDPAIPFDIEATEREFQARILGQGEAV
jgi:ATP-dependent Clp protease ATP-binding subunit ClpC